MIKVEVVGYPVMLGAWDAFTPTIFSRSLTTEVNWFMRAISAAVVAASLVAAPVLPAPVLPAPVLTAPALLVPEAPAAMVAAVVFGAVPTGPGGGTTWGLVLVGSGGLFAPPPGVVL